jgi:hypothetical protein
MASLLTTCAACPYTQA